MLGPGRGDYMGEGEALIQRRKMLLDKISKMNNEVEKIDQRLNFLGRAAASKRLIDMGLSLQK
jgi:hypothetical protein